MSSAPKASIVTAHILHSVTSFCYACTVVLCFLIALQPVGRAQANPQSAATSATATQETAGSNQNSPELSSHDEPTIFKVNVKLVVARVVVRDKQGHAVGNLHKEDFQLFDNNKPQVITQFSTEQPGSQVTREQKTSEASTETPPSPANISKNPDLPERFIAYLFDDVHLKFEDVVRIREAAMHHLDSLQPTDRAAIFTSSGQNILDFTDDRSQLRAMLLQIRPRPVEPMAAHPCPFMSYYMADMIVEHNDASVIDAASKDAFHCTTFQDPNEPGLLQAPQAQYNLTRFLQAQSLAKTTAMHVFQVGHTESHMVLGSLKDVVRRMSSLPGQRSIVLASPGFLTPDLQDEIMEVVDKAVHANVMVGTIDARGLYAKPAGGDASGLSSPDMVGGPEESQFESAAAITNDDVLAAIADGTGGTFIHNNNDMNEALERTVSAPEFSYVIGFSPLNLKADGSFHTLKITLRNSEKLVLQARRGYFAPKSFADPEQEAKQEIEDALFSQEELHDLPVQLHTQFFKASQDDARLTVLAHVDVRQLRFRKADGRNQNVLTVASVLFNRNGSFVQGTQKIVTMHLKDETLEHKLLNGMTLKTEFNVKPGSYLVRLVVRDSEGRRMAAENGAVEIP